MVPRVVPSSVGQAYGSTHRPAKVIKNCSLCITMTMFIFQKDSGRSLLEIHIKQKHEYKYMLVTCIQLMGMDNKYFILVL